MIETTIPPRAPVFSVRLDSLQDKSVLVGVEYGAGDSIMMMRYFPHLRARCARLILEARAEMVGLYATYFPDYEIVPYPSETRDVVHVPLMSLPRLLGPAVGWEPISPLPPSVQYVRHSRAGIGIVPDCLVAPGGVTWPGNGRFLKNPPPEMIAGLEGEFGPFLSLRHADLGHCTWAETAEVMAGLELVITVDSGPAHLAASLGIKTWVLQRHEAHGGDWRWGIPSWYPGVARVFQQDQPGDWAGVFHDVRTALERRNAV